MTLAHVFLIYAMVIAAFSVISTTATIGKPRKPITPGLAVGVTIYGAVYMSGLVYAYTQL